MPEALYHFSHDPTIERFRPHVAATSAHDEPFVWAIDSEHEPLYWFPRDCPRVTFWVGPRTPPEAARWYHAQTDAPRVTCAETAWFERIRSATLYRYRFDPAPFTCLDGGAGHWVARTEVVPLGVDTLDDLLARHIGSGDELRFVPSLWPLHAFLRSSGLGFSMTRLRNATARPDD